MTDKNNSLIRIAPELVEEWHPTKNGKHSPSSVTAGSKKNVWWKCKKGHEWQAVVYKRKNGAGCPVCNGYRVTQENCLSVQNPGLAKQWHPVKNGNLTPFLIKPGSNKKVWWKCKEGHEWQAVISSRNRGNGCPYCSGRKVNENNSLVKLNPELAAQWHPTKNGDLQISNFSAGSGKKVWWRCKEGHEWEAVIASRNSGRGCPFCSGQRVMKHTSLRYLILNYRNSGTLLKILI